VSRLIFVEGFPGAGKSTTAQFLARQLARRGGRARWVYEGEVPNPLVPTTPSGGYASWEQFANRHVERWRTFAVAAAEHDVTVVPESALLQLPVFTMLRRNLDPTVIADLVGRLVEAARPLRPSLVYLARRDPEGAFKAIGERRGIAWLLHHVASSSGYAFVQARGLTGLEGLLAYWRAHAELCDKLVDQADLPQLVLDVEANGWAERRRRICDFVDVPYHDELVADATAVARVTGRYSDGKRTVTIETVEGHLALTVMLGRRYALLPVAPDVFDVEAWPHRLSFTGEQAERADTFHGHGPQTAWGGPPGAFRRV
jgi:hypothetical protein